MELVFSFQKAKNPLHPICKQSLFLYRRKKKGGWTEVTGSETGEPHKPPPIYRAYLRRDSSANEILHPARYTEGVDWVEKQTHLASGPGTDFLEFTSYWRHNLAGTSIECGIWFCGKSFHKLQMSQMESIVCCGNCLDQNSDPITNTFQCNATTCNESNSYSELQNLQQ